MKKAKGGELSLLLLVFVLSAAVGVSRLWPGWSDKHATASTVDQGAAGGKAEGSSYAISEPASILLLGAGLVSLGLYAKLKQGKQH